jgi:O-acetyl-ADP-ribose deacetylase
MDVKVLKCDITELKVDAIVNTANCSLLGGGGVDGAIHRKAGSGLLEECRKFGGCKTGEAVITNAYNLPCQYVIHTSGPVWHGGNNGEPELLQSCYNNCLELAEENKILTLVFPAISTGVYRYPIREAAKIAVKTVKKWQREFPQKLIFVAFNNEIFDVYKQILNRK